MPTLAFTEALVRERLFGQFDDGGVPMADHCMRVWQRVSDLDEDTQHVAWLHDILEDTDTTPEELYQLGYSNEVVQAVLLLTKPKKEPYADYIEALCASGNQKAIIVKLADNADNTDPHRWLSLNPFKAQALAKRYAGVADKLRRALR